MQHLPGKPIDRVLVIAGMIAILAVGIALSGSGGSSLTHAEAAAVTRCQTNGTSSSSMCECAVKKAEAHGVPADKLYANHSAVLFSHPDAINAMMSCVSLGDWVSALHKVGQGLSQP
jgi:hypothetical protein